MKAADPNVIEVLPITTEDGISALAFVFKEPLEQYGGNILEVAMDSTCQFCRCHLEAVKLTSI